MKTYTVKEIADILKTNPETVRRWIRLGKLEAEQSSRKGGNVVTAQSLNKFLKSTPKYAGIAASTIGLLGVPGLIAGVPILTATFLGSLIAQKSQIEEKINNSQIPITEMIKFIESSTRSSQKIIASKKEEIKKLNLEIKAEEQQIQDLKELLVKLASQQRQTKSAERRE